MGFLSLIAKLGIDTSGYETGLKRAESLSNKWAGKVGGDIRSVFLGTFGANALYEGLKSTFQTSLNYAKELAHLSEQNDMTPEQLQRLSKAAKRYGLDFEDFQTAISKFTGARADAMKNEDTRKTFKRLGVDIKDLLDPSQNFFDIAIKIGEALKLIKVDPQTRQDFRDLFGKKGDKLIASIQALPSTPLGYGLSNEETRRIYEQQRNYEQAVKTVKGAITRGVGNAFSLFGMLKDPQHSYFEKLRREQEEKESLQPGPPMVDALQKKQEEDHMKDLIKLYDMGNKILMERMTIQDQLKYKQAEITALQIAAENATAEELPGIRDKIDLKTQELINAQYSAENQKIPGFHKVSANSLQQIGAFSGVDPIVRGIDRSNSLLNEIGKNTRETARKLGDSQDQYP